jgi:hypothetical protein
LKSSEILSRIFSQTVLFKNRHGFAYQKSCIFKQKLIIGHNLKKAQSNSTPEVKGKSKMTGAYFVMQQAPFIY